MSLPQLFKETWFQKTHDRFIGFIKTAFFTRKCLTCYFLKGKKKKKILTVQKSVKKDAVLVYQRVCETLKGEVLCSGVSRDPRLGFSKLRREKGMGGLSHFPGRPWGVQVAGLLCRANENKGQAA